VRINRIKNSYKAFPNAAPIGKMSSPRAETVSSRNLNNLSYVKFNIQKAHCYFLKTNIQKYFIVVPYYSEFYW
jgi:hypothetical protein